MWFAVHCHFAARDTAACPPHAGNMEATLSTDVYHACPSIFLAVCRYHNVFNVEVRSLTAEH